ncbi:MAG: hypothetical protein NC218_04975 [Acetobacter sp.]|nr:hypothetical protein [Acetobacter sp.]
MVRKVIKLSVFVGLMSLISATKADSFLLPVKANVCTPISAEKARSDIRYQTYDKAAYVAVKSSSYMQKKANELDDHLYGLLAYRLADKVLNDVSVVTIRDDDEKICLELSGYLDTKKADEILKENKISGNTPQNVKKIAQEVNTILPKSIYETDETIPLIYIKDIEFYNNTSTSAYTRKIAQKLSFEPRVLVTENKELADYFIVPKLLQSKIEKIDSTHSRFSMSVEVELQKINGIVVGSEQQNRYIIISEEQDSQEIAQKLIIKLLDRALEAMTGKLNSLLKY